MWFTGTKREFTFTKSGKVEDRKVLWEYMLTRKKPTGWEYDIDLGNGVHEHCTHWIASYCEDIYLNDSVSEWIEKNLGEMYDGQPIEVELYINEEKPVLYVQRMADAVGTKHLYTIPFVHNIRRYKRKGIWPFRRIIELVTAPVQISKDHGRLPMNMFPEITEESGIVGLAIRFKNPPIVADDDEPTDVEYVFHGGFELDES